MNEFETFGFNIEEKGGKDTLNMLDNILSRLEKIQKLQNGGIGASKPNSTTTRRRSSAEVQDMKLLHSNMEQVNASITKLNENLLLTVDALTKIATQSSKVKTAASNIGNSLSSVVAPKTNATTKAQDFENFGFVYDVDIENAKKKALEQNLKQATDLIALQERLNSGRYEELEIVKQKLKADQKAIENRVKEQWKIANSTKTEGSPQSRLGIENQTRLAIEGKVNAQEKSIDKNNQEVKSLKKVEAQQKKNNNTQEKTNKGLLSYGIRLTTVIALARKLARFTSEAIKESAGFVENLNLFAVTFGESYEETAKWALDLANNLGLASSEAIRFTGLFKQLSTAIGNSAEVGTEMSKVLTQFGYDLASFYNIDVTSAMEKLQAGIYSGQTKPLRTIGIDVTYQSIDNLLETNAALAQFNTSSKQLDQSQKAIARTIIALQSGSNAFGDMERTIGSLANQLRVFEAGLSNFKLAIGDLVNEPLANAMVYINGFLQGITQVIRAFKPLEISDKDNMVANLGADAEETNEALDETQKRLAGFDKFNVLQVRSTTSDEDITTALTAELQKQIALYDEQSLATSQAAEKMAEYAKKVRDFFIVVDENGDFVEWTSGAKALAGALITVAVAITYIGVSSLIAKLSTLNGSFGLLNTVIISGVVYSIIKMIEAFKEGDVASGLLFGTIGGIGVASFVALNYEMLKTMGIKIANFFKNLGNTLLKDVIPNLSASHTLMKNVLNATILLAGALILFEGIKSFANVWNDMSGWERATNIIVALTAAIAGFVVATKALHLGVAGAIGVGAALAGGVLLIGSQIKQNQIKGHAEGGFSNANLIMTHENGIREWVGRQGTSSAIVNDTQMSDIMEMAVARGVYEANMASKEVGTSNGVIHNHIYMDGKQIYEGVTNTAKQYGKTWSKA